MTADDLYDDAIEIVTDAMAGKTVNSDKLNEAHKLLQLVMVSIWSNRQNSEFSERIEDKGD